uniref:Reverse transcriptase Ty1/copia-type domain-containing protein n=1 Tax=Fagus sylvatica TaxID=28930 RepID=A0A2N9HT29_FAGSY
MASSSTTPPAGSASPLTTGERSGTLAAASTTSIEAVVDVPRGSSIRFRRSHAHWNWTVTGSKVVVDRAWVPCLDEISDLLIQKGDIQPVPINFEFPCAASKDWDTELLREVLRRWCPSTHIFFFTWGELTVTLEDIANHWMLPILGEHSFSGIKLSAEEENVAAALRRHSSTRISSWPALFVHCEDIPVRRAAFILYWLYRFPDFRNNLPLVYRWVGLKTRDHDLVAALDFEENVLLRPYGDDHPGFACVSIFSQFNQPTSLIYDLRVEDHRSLAYLSADVPAGPQEVTTSSPNLAPFIKSRAFAHCERESAIAYGNSKKLGFAEWDETRDGWIAYTTHLSEGSKRDTPVDPAVEKDSKKLAPSLKKTSSTKTKVGKKSGSAVPKPSPERESATSLSQAAIVSAAAPSRAKGVASGSFKSNSTATPSSNAGKKSVASRPPKGQRKTSTSSSSSGKEQPSAASTPSPSRRKKFVAPLFPFGAATRTRSKSGFMATHEPGKPSGSVVVVKDLDMVVDDILTSSFNREDPLTAAADQGDNMRRSFEGDFETDIGSTEGSHSFSSDSLFDIKPPIVWSRSRLLLAVASNSQDPRMCDGWGLNITPYLKHLAHKVWVVFLELEQELPCSIIWISFFPLHKHFCHCSLEIGVIVFPNLALRQDTWKTGCMQASSGSSSFGKDKTWLLDSAASHNITGDLSNLSIHSEYDGTDEVILGDGSAQPYFSPSKPAPPLPNQTAQSTHHCLPLFFEAPLPAVPPSTLSGVPPSPPLQEGAPAIVAQSSGNSETPSGALLHNCLHALGSIPPSHARLGESSSPLPLTSPDSSAAASTPSSPNPDSPTIPEIPNPPQRTHQMTTRSMNQIFKLKQLHTVSKYPLPQTIEPTSVSQAVSQPHWREAMSNKLTALMKHGTWDLILPPSHCKPVGCKWVFRVKRKADGSVDRFKARLVAKGYNQRPGVDYKDTFSPVVKPATIRAVLSIAVMNGWSLRQMDINNAFLNGELTETVFMEQPPGFKDLSKPNHVCRLKKAIYGLKQAPRAWYTALKNAILQLGFSNSKADSSLFIYSQGSTLCYFLVYVDDLVITRNNSLFVASIIKQLGDMFSLKDMGPLHFFLGIEVIPTQAGLFLSQHNSEFRRILGSLQYLSLTRPDISFAVNKLSQFMHKPTSNHWTAIKRLLRYLKQTIFHGFQITNIGPPVLRTYSDADWAGNIDDRTSTSAYISFLGSNPISWSSKKQRAVARSTTEAEYRALGNAASEIMWLSTLFKELNFPVKDSPVVM